jgi:hypothetical protein
VRRLANPVAWKLNFSVFPPVALQFLQFALLRSVTCVQLRLITILGKCGCVAVASFLGVLEKLEKIQYRAIRGALGYRSSTLTNKMLAEAKEISIFCRVGKNYEPRCYMSSNHPVVQLLEELSILVDNPWRVENEQPLISENYKEVTSLDHLIQ